MDITTPSETADVLRHVAATEGLPFAIEEAERLTVGAVGFMIAQAGHDRTAAFVRELLEAIPAH